LTTNAKTRCGDVDAHMTVAGWGSNFGELSQRRWQGDGEATISAALKRRQTGC
jgi:hypothetical protein